METLHIACQESVPKARHRDSRENGQNQVENGPVENCRVFDTPKVRYNSLARRQQKARFDTLNPPMTGMAQFRQPKMIAQSSFPTFVLSRGFLFSLFSPEALFAPMPGSSTFGLPL
jgi:hypothetical protein